jgi:hypothetical protein
VPVTANEGGFCVPAVPSGNPCHTPFGTCHDGVCNEHALPDDTSCPVVPANACYTGACKSGNCVVSEVGFFSICEIDPDDLCQRGRCLYRNPGGPFCCNSTGQCPNCSGLVCKPDADTPPKTCSQDQCGPQTCDPATGMCVSAGAPPPSFGQIACDGPGFTSDPSRCCPDQACICGPTGTGIPSFCLEHGCWNPEDVPGHFDF